MVNTPANARDRGSIRGQEDPWRREWQPTPVLLPGKSHGQRSLVGYRPWGRKESDMTKETWHTRMPGGHQNVGHIMGERKAWTDKVRLLRVLVP